MRFQADNPLRADLRVMDNPRGQIKPIAYFQGQLLSQLGQAKGNASLHNIDYLVIGMRVRRINVKWAI